MRCNDRVPELIDETVIFRCRDPYSGSGLCDLVSAANVQSFIALQSTHPARPSMFSSADVPVSVAVIGASVHATAVLSEALLVQKKVCQRTLNSDHVRWLANRGLPRLDLQ